MDTNTKSMFLLLQAANWDWSNFFAFSADFVQIPVNPHGKKVNKSVASIIDNM